MTEESNLLRQRREKAEDMEKSGVELYSDQADPTHEIGDIVGRYGSCDTGVLEKLDTVFTIDGRIMSLRRFGKAAFLHLQDSSGRLQVHVRKDLLGADMFGLFKKFDIGDLIEVSGRLFRTRTNELTLSAALIRLVTKSLRPLPEKYHGIKDKELRYRQRYTDLIMNREVRETFRTRSRIVQIIREYFDSQGFLEVETPMMQSIVGGATARPFQTFHNALDINLFLRIAPELYLKRLLVGGYNKVFELNRNFRNEGISIQHNPEFTMLEFYEAYARFADLMDRTEELFVLIAEKLGLGTVVRYQGVDVDLSPPWKRMTLAEALEEIGGISGDKLLDRDWLVAKLKELGAPVTGSELTGKFLTKLFDLLVEPKLVQPTFITHYPTDISPLARKNRDNPEVTDRFELFITGREMANGFSELNDPRDQYRRFKEQIANRGEDEEIPPELDEDYVRALEVGMPPAAGEGIGVDRVVMLFTDSPSIRDVILFPQLRPEYHDRRDD
ncbi:MAG TPA: lysine--tRNA ligase [Thermodesulfobacteriaceae bacterium]|nr:lysine--tRNA ligase [Thermodesulfobacteriaceae bacterium]